MRAQAQGSSSAANRDGSAPRGSVFGRSDAATRASSHSSDGSGAPSHRARLAVLALAIASFATLALAPGASAKEVSDYFGTEANSGTLGGQFFLIGDIAVNNTGAGPADAGDVYTTETGQVGNSNSRVQRFAYDDNGTPADRYDDNYTFVSAWGADVVSPGGTGDLGDAADADYEICTVAAECKAGVASAGNGSAAGNGSLWSPRWIAVDQDTGNVYVTDGASNRVNVYSGDGAFLRSFGWDVVASGPGDLPGTNESQQLTVRATGGKFSLLFDGASTGDVGRGTTYSGITTVENVTMRQGAFFVGESISGQGIAPGTTIAAIDAGVKKLTLSQPPLSASGGTPDLYGNLLDHNISAAALQSALNALPTIGGAGGSVSVSGGPGDLTGASPYTIAFDGGSLAGRDVSALIAQQGFTITSGTPSAVVSESVKGGAYEVCVAANGDVCRAGAPGPAVGQLGLSNGSSLSGALAINPGDGNPATGKVFVTDNANRRVATYDLDDSNPASFGSAAQFSSGPMQIAVDSRGIVYTSEGSAASTQIDRYDSQNANGGGVGFLASIAAPPLTRTSGSSTIGIEVDPDSDGAGPDTDVLYVLNSSATGPSVVRQFGPVKKPGLTSPPLTEDAHHGERAGFNRVAGLGLDEASGRLYVSTVENIGGSFSLFGEKSGIYVLDAADPLPSSAIDSITDITGTTARVNGTINPNGGPDVSYRLEYSTDGVNWKQTPAVLLGRQSTDQALSVALDPADGGLAPNTLYHVRLAAIKAFAPAVNSTEQTFTTAPAPPLVETTASPIRTATTALLESRVNPRGSATTFHFEYGTQGPCDANPCAQTPDQPTAGSGNLVELVSQRVAGLSPDTVYHYRVLADNGQSATGADRTLRTRASDAPLEHGQFPGPVGSDRAWEQVSLPETSGNPVDSADAVSVDGNRAIYQVRGGTDLGTLGFQAAYFARRTPSGWQTQNVMPPADQLGIGWLTESENHDLSGFLGVSQGRAVGDLPSDPSRWRLFKIDPDADPPATELYQFQGTAVDPNPLAGITLASDDLSRVLWHLAGDTVPRPSKFGQGVPNEAYDVTSGPPTLASQLPDGSVSPCGVLDPRLSSDGSLLLFASDGADPGCSTSGIAGDRLYLRDLNAGVTARITPGPLSGLDCGVSLIKPTASFDAVFFWTQSSLVAEDTVPDTCGTISGRSFDGDVYRYDIGGGGLQCVTCVAPGLDVDVDVAVSTNPDTSIALADDGSRLYFKTRVHLLAGAPPDGQWSFYRLDLASGELAFVAGPVSVGDNVGSGGEHQAIAPDGSALLFRSASTALNQLSGANNGATQQYYLYEDAARGLHCVSCPADGAAPLGDASGGSATSFAQLADDGTVAFGTPTALVGADQNTPSGGSIAPGTDVYEWRDGRQLLVSDGLTNSSTQPGVWRITPSGNDIFFTASARYTPDAPDAINRLYDARIGGGIEFPAPPPPCPLEVCQGTPRGAPERVSWGSTTFSGPGNPAAAKPKPRRCAKGKRKVRRNGKVRCVKRHQKKRGAQRRANPDRRATR